MWAELKLDEPLEFEAGYAVSVTHEITHCLHSLRVLK